MVKVCLVLIFIAIALYLPPLALFILILASGKIGVWPAIIYMFLISGIYAIKNRGKNE